MHTGHGRDGPGTKGRGRGDPDEIPSTPDQTPRASASAFSYGSRMVAVGQATLPHVEGGDSAALAWDSGWQAERGFRVRTTIGLSPDGGLRRKWAERLLFGPDQQAVDEDRFDKGDGDDPGLSGVREPQRGPGGSDSDSAAVQPVFAHDPHTLSLVAG